MSDLKVHFWGTRGSIPTPGRATEKFGGNTTCVELCYEDHHIIIDAGSGISQLSDHWLSTGQTLDADMLLTHLHWDHIQGFPFFVPAYIPGNKLRIHAEPRPTGALRDLLSGQMEGDYFPVPLKTMQGDLAFHDTAPFFDIGSIKVRTFPMPHPGGCLGYRFEIDGQVFVFATDSELDQIAINKDELKSNHPAPRQHYPEVLSFFENANLVVIDCQYTDDEYRKKPGWGHNSIAAIADLCEHTKPQRLGLFHHDPKSDDAAVTAMVADANARLKARNIKQVEIFGAREGMMLRCVSQICTE